MDSEKHSKATGAKARISTTEGGRYSAHGNYINGKNLQLVKNRLIVQTWRANNWDKNEVDSTLIMLLQPQERGTVLYFTHANVPENEYMILKKDGMSITGHPGKNT